MDQVIWVEVLSRRRDVAARFRFTGEEVRIGRGYDSDVVLDDPFVAPQHVRVYRNGAGQLVAEDAGSVNGLFTERGKDRHQQIVLDGEQPIRIGHTLVRIRDGRHAVAPERAGASTPALAIAAIVVLWVALLGVEALSTWLGQTGEPRASAYVMPLLAVGGFVVVWVAGWTLLTRILSGQPRLERNLLIALTAALAYSLYNEFADFSGFALGWPVFSNYGYVATWCALAAAAFFHWREASPLRLEVKGAVVVALLALAITTQTLMHREDYAEYGRQNASRRLLPPGLRLAPLRDEATFFGDVHRLKARLDRERDRERYRAAD
jgi:hypothetical protein